LNNIEEKLQEIAEIGFDKLLLNRCQIKSGDRFKYGAQFTIGEYQTYISYIRKFNKNLKTSK